uniref:Dynein heavy chain linker domain-containing protein n=1 Tax=Mola mola TaxID=94237 RepID=A0A3Q3X6X1_MOLML
MDDDSLQTYHLCTHKRQRLLPRLPRDIEPSDQYKVSLLHNRYPPLLQSSSRTLAAPYKEQRYSRTPSESIGNNYTPQAQNLKVRKLKQKRHTRQCLEKELDPSNFFTPVIPPMSPTRQLDIMQRQEKKMRAMEREPTERDLKRYMYYINNGIPSSVLPPMPDKQMRNIRGLLPRDTEDSKHLQIVRAKLEEEVKSVYEFGLKKSIVDYILMDAAERQRLTIFSIPKHFPSKVITAPVPWGARYKEVLNWQKQHVFAATPLMVQLQHIWQSSFASLRFIKLEKSTCLPLLPSEFEKLPQLNLPPSSFRWLPQCVSLLDTSQDLWMPLIPDNKHLAPLSCKEFFNCVATLMSLQLRSLVVESLQDFLHFFTKYEGNDFGEVFDYLKYVQSQLLLVKLQVKEDHIDFSPSFQNCWDLIHSAFMEIINGVECVLFPDVKDNYLRIIYPDESLVTELIDKAEDIFHKNTVGPEKYLNYYRKYSNLLDHSAEQDISAFLKEKHAFEGFAEKMKSVNHLRNEIVALNSTVALSMFCLDACELNNELHDRAKRLDDMITTFLMEKNREMNKG